MDSADDATDELPAASVRVAEILHVPSSRVPNVQFVALPTTYVHETDVEPFVAVNVIVSPADPPDAPSVGVESLVTLSVDDVPVLDPDARSTAVGAAGAVVSIAIERAVDVAEVPPVGCA
jgi:hypothetical protein